MWHVTHLQDELYQQHLSWPELKLRKLSSDRSSLFTWANPMAPSPMPSVVSLGRNGGLHLASMQRRDYHSFCVLSLFCGFFFTES